MPNEVMMRIDSGPTGERRVRTLLMFIGVTTFAFWFAYDGWIGYPKKNLAEHLEQLPSDERENAAGAVIFEQVTATSLEAAKAALKNRDPAQRRAALETLYGGPPSHKNAEAWYYFGPSFGITMPLENGRLERAIGRKTKKSATDILIQRSLAVGLGIGALALLWSLVRVLQTRLVLDDGGLSYRGRGPIRWEDMKTLDTRRFAKKGWVDLIHDDHGTKRSLRLDEYHLAEFAAVIGEMCRRKGFEDPLVTDEDGGQEPA
jgi:hypothetical protein